MGIAAVGVRVISWSPVLVILTFMSSTWSPLSGTKLVTSHFKPKVRFSLIIWCQRNPALKRRDSCSEAKLCCGVFPVTDQGPQPSRKNQKFRAALVLCRSATETGGNKKWCCPVLLSPCSRGEIADIIPASLARGKYKP